MSLLVAAKTLQKDNNVSDPSLCRDLQFVDVTSNTSAESSPDVLKR